MTVSKEVRKEMNRAWREQHPPSETSQAAFQSVIETGSLSDEAHEAVVNELTEAIKPRLFNHDREPGENRLMSAAERRDDGVSLRISNRLFYQQPLGVISREVHHRVNGEGSAVIVDACPRSETVAEDIMAIEHIELHVIPMPVWLNRFIGIEEGYEVPTS